MTVQVGLDPARDIHWAEKSGEEAIQLLAALDYRAPARPVFESGTLCRGTGPSGAAIAAGGCSCWLSSSLDHSMSRSARRIKDCGMVSPRAFAVLRLMIN